MGSKISAFTLAEVLITLGVIGVVSAITIPSVINKYQEKVTVTRLKQTYSILSQAFTNIVANEGTPDTWDINSPDDFRDLFAKYLRNVKKCNELSNEKCNSEITHNLHGNIKRNFNNNGGHSSLALNNGTVLTFSHGIRTDCDLLYGGLPEACDLGIHVDVNGIKVPNTWGKDRFQFAIYKTKILPVGTSDMDNFETRCLNDNADGFACAGWVIQNENLDYLHCPEKIGWDKASSCK